MKHRKIIKDKKKEWNHQTLFSKVIAEIKALQNLNQRNANAHAEDEEDMDNWFDNANIGNDENRELWFNYFFNPISLSI